ncbi:MAG: FHA domain-containing protein [Candidatus Saccharimonas sp.]|nr:FHA domain-containing protein [Planctomycetaceae bacterium]
MSDDRPTMRITATDMSAPVVEEYLEAQAYLTRDVDDVGDQPWLIRVIYANWFYLALTGTLGGLVGWMILEPFYKDHDEAVNLSRVVVTISIFPVVVGFVGMFVGAAEGLMCRNGQRAVISGAVGLGVGFVGGLIALIPTAFVFSLMHELSTAFSRDPQAGEMPTGLALLILMMGRAAAWGIAAIPAGIGQGIALQERKVIINGLVGGVLGGMVGGLLFDPISLILTSADGQATYSRAVGFMTIGLFVGLFIGLVEGWTKTAWLLMRKGPLAGKQFILYKDTTILGSSPKAGIYLFKDDAIEPRHAVISNRGGRFEIEDQTTPDGTYVNGIPITRHILQNGDQIVLGKTVLEFTLKENKT